MATPREDIDELVDENELLSSENRHRNADDAVLDLSDEELLRRVMELEGFMSTGEEAEEEEAVGQQEDLEDGGF